MLSSTSPAYRPAGALAAAPLDPYDGPWNARLSAHLLRRAGFGGTPADVRRYAQLSTRAAVAALVSARHPGDRPDAPQLPDETGIVQQLAAARQTQRATDPAFKEIQRQRRKLEREGVIAAQLWWLDRMIATPAPLQEKMTLFWHGHFTTAAIQKGVTPAEVVAQNALFRQFALGNARELTQRVSTDAAMLKYLDNRLNVKSHPNENFARELMELYTLGIGNYTEIDVREAARAWTGLRVARNGAVVFDSRLHDDGTKSFLGRTGNFTGRDIVDIIFQAPATATFFATKLLRAFVYDDPEPVLVDGVAALLRKNDFNLTPVMATLFESNVFYSERAYRALVKSPVEYVVGSYQLFGVRTADRKALASLRRMGQTLFYPPNVKGWPGGSSWINTATVLARENFANALMTETTVANPSGWLLQNGPNDPRETAKALVATIVQGDASPAALERLAAYLAGDESSANGALSLENFGQRMRGGAYLTMAMPAYQLA